MSFPFLAAKPKPRRGTSLRFLRKGRVERREVRLAPGRPSRVPRDVIGLWILFLSTATYVALFSQFFLINDIRITGLAAVAEADVRATLAEQLSQRQYGFLPARNFFMVRTANLERQLLEQYPKISVVRVTRVFPDQLQLEVRERAKIILWCASGAAPDTAQTPTGQTCFLIDENGKAWERPRALLPQYASDTLVIEDLSGKPVLPGERVFEPEYGIFVARLQDLFLQKLGQTIEPRMTTASRFAEDVKIRTQEGWEAYLNPQISPEDAMETLSLLFAQELPPEKRASLAYVDLRTANRVYYAFREVPEAGKTNADAPQDVPLSEEKTKEASPSSP